MNEDASAFKDALENLNTPKSTSRSILIGILSTENHCCCDKQPLLNIPLDHTLVGELHLMLHVEDILIGNLVWEFLDWNKYDHLHSKKGNSKRVTIRVIRSCGVSFDVRDQRNADGKASGKQDWTSLLGKDKKFHLADLPSKLNSILRPETVSAVVEVWTEFLEISKVVNSWHPEKE